MERLTEEELAAAVRLAQFVTVHEPLTDRKRHVSLLAQDEAMHTIAGAADRYAAEASTLARALLHLHAKLAAASAVVEAFSLTDEERWLIGLLPGVLESTFQRAAIEAAISGTADPVRANIDKLIAVVDRLIAVVDAMRTGEVSK